MSVGLRTRVADVALDAVQQAGVRFYALRGEKVAKLMTPAGLADPYPLYAQLQAEGSVIESRLGVWLVTSHEAVGAAVRDTRLTVDNRVLDEYVEDPEAEIHDHEMMLRMDPPGHTRIRRLVGKAFSPKTIAALRPKVTEISDELLAAATAQGGGFDVVGDYAVPLTVRVICHLLGVPHDEWRQFRVWGDDVTRTMGAMTTRADRRVAHEAGQALGQYMTDHIARKRLEPAGDLLSEMIRAEEEGDKLSDRELLANAILILLAGFETTVNLIGNGTVALLANRDQWDKLAADETLVPNAVEELLRYDSPVQFTGRNAPEDLEIGGRLVPKGKQLMIMLAAANNDPSVFDDPRRLDITRANAREHVAFSSGAHYCLGASLARLEGEVAFSALARYPSLRATGKPVRKRTDLLRGYESVPVAI